MGAVGEIFLGALLQVLFQKISDELLKFVRSREDVHKKLKKWRKTLVMIEAVLSDAEEKQLTSKAVKLWLDDLRDLAYDVEDVLDKFFTRLLQHKIETLERATTSNVLCLIPTCCTGLSPCSFGLFMHKMNSNIDEITGRLHDITQRKNELGLNDSGRSVIEWKRPPSSSLPDGHVFGRDEDKKRIVELLLRDQQSSLNFDVVGIVGLPGVGKTTLAGLVFHDDAIKHFDIRVWVCVSNSFDCVRLTQAILKSIKLESDINQEFCKLQEHLSRLLAGKKFLIILDDVWNTKNDLHDLWVGLRSPFKAGAPGSKIIVTTREVNVAKVMGAVQHHNLECVSDDDCWKIFVQNAFFIRDTSELPHLGLLREKILAKCNGLPLAARTLGGLLHCKEINEWEDVLNDKLWTLSNHSNILPVLRLSYCHLPLHLKRCFAYCAILPEDYEFEEKQVILLWTAEGLIQQPESSKQIEELGREYFHELLSRSFFQKSRKDESRYVMHDLMNDLAQWAAGEICFRLEDKQDGDKRCRIFEKSRHSSYVSTEFDGIQRLEAFSKVKHLRTFLPLGQSFLPLRESFPSGKRLYLTSKFTIDILPKLQYLRVLSLKGYYIPELPDSIGELKLLQYLDLSYTYLTSLPKSISSLYNLQTLLLECCHLDELPNDLKNLTNLRHLNNSKQMHLKGMPPDLGKLTNLQMLSNFVVGKETGSSSVGELGPLLHLRGILSITGLENVNRPEDAAMANLAGKNGIDVLLLKWNKGEITDEHVLEMLQPPRLLMELTVMCYGGLKFPNWMGNLSFSNMVLIRLEDCKECRFLPPLGKLVSLKTLAVKRLCGIDKVGSAFYGEGCLKPFPLLETLSFENMENWEDWFQLDYIAGIEGFTKLKELSLKRCPKLKGKLPGSLPSLEKIVVDGCDQLVVSIPKNQMLSKLYIDNCKEIVCEDEADISRVMSLDISHVSEFRYPTKGLTRLKDLKVYGLKEMSCLLDLTLIQELHICDCPSLTCFPMPDLQSSLRVLQIVGCENLISLVRDNDYNIGIPPNSNCLESLEIRHCPSLKSISSANGLQPRYKTLCISNCDTLECLSWGKLPDTLRNLQIEYCDSLICLSFEGELPEELESLRITSCRMLKSLKSSEAKLPKELKILHIDSCGQLESIADRFDYAITPCLESVYLYHCKNLRSLPELHHLINLSELRIKFCENLVSFPQGGLPAPNLRLLYVKSDAMVKYPKGMMQNLIFLQQLEISYCEGLVRVLEQDGFPPNLASLIIWKLKESKPLFQRGLLCRLTSLRELELRGEATDVVLFPPDQHEEEKQQQEGSMRMMLPNSLITLRIWNFKNLEKLSAGIRCLKSLQFLFIHHCKKLNSLPDEGLPISLSKLVISDCPMLKKQFTTDAGRLIAHIPCVMVDMYY